MIKHKHLRLIGLFGVISFFLYDSSCGKNNPLENGSNTPGPNPPGPGPIPDKDPVPPHVEDLTLWCRYRSTDYGRFYETAGLDQNGNVVTYAKDKTYFWECPDPYYPLPGSEEFQLSAEPPPPQPKCPRFFSNETTYIYSDLYFVVNNTSPNIRDNFEKQAMDSCIKYTPHEGAEFIEYGIRSQLDLHPYLFHKPFFSNVPSNIPQGSLPFTRIVVFGDSISDNGYFWDEAAHLILQWPYFMGRFSNGPVWVDHLIKQLNIKQNSNPKVDLYDYAVGGAGSATAGYNYGFSGLDKQVTRYLDGMAQTASKDLNWDPGYDKTLYVIFIGTNDYFVLADSSLTDLALYCGLNIDPTHPETVFYSEPCAKTVIYGNDVIGYKSVGLKEDIRKILLQAGPGKEMFFLIPLEPDLSSLPYYNLYRIPPPPKERIAPSFFVQAAALSHNKLLKQALTEIEEEFRGKNTIHFLILELDKVFNGLINDTSGIYYEIARDSGLKYKSTECFGGAALDTTPSFDFCLDPASWMFWDGAHPTTTTHCDIAEFTLVTLYKNFTTTTYTPDYTKCHNSYVTQPLNPF